MSFVLVPGAGGDPWYWHRVAPMLGASGEEVVAVRLPAEDASAGLEAYTEAIVAAAEDTGEITLVAASLAGFSAPQACARLAVRRLVLVNAMIPLPGETAGEWWAATGQGDARRAAAEQDGRPLSDGVDVVAEFFHDVPDDVRREAFARPEPVQTDGPFADPWPLPAWPDVPTSVVAGADDRLFPPAFQRRVARDRIGLELEVVPGGHLVALSRPEPLAAHLLALRG